jgi:hypothetical protein
MPSSVDAQPTTPPIIGRIENDRFIMDPRTLQEEELDIIEKAFADMLADGTEEGKSMAKHAPESV